MAEVVGSERQYYRVDLNIPCTVQLRKIASKQLSNGESFEVNLLNLSGGGLCFTTDRDLLVNDLMIWQFGIQLFAETVELLFGELVRKKREESYFEYGVRFFFVDEKAQKELIRKLQLYEIRKRQKEKTFLV